MTILNEQELLTNIATNATEIAITGAWNKVKKFFKDLDAKDSIRYRTAYEKYLLNTKQKNSKIKTIISRRVPQDLYSLYVCIDISYNGQTINTQNICNLIEIGNKIIVTGTGGAGKSILFKHLFLNTIENTAFIPVLLELRNFNEYDLHNISLYNSIYKSLCDNGFNLSDEYFHYSMKEGSYIIFLDGFDEVNRDKIKKITNEIKELSEKYNYNKYFLSSRPSEEFIGWNDFCEAEALELSKEQALAMIKKIDFDETTKNTFYNELNNSLFEQYKSFASNPLLLNIMLLTFQKHASIPEKLNDFYEEAFVTLYNVHDATKDSYTRDIRSSLGCEDFKLVFSYICFKSYFKDQFQFSETELRDYIQMAKEKFDTLNFSIDDFQEDLTQSVCMVVKEGLTYHFSHRSFQEYFAAWYTCKLVDEIQSKLLLSWIKESPSVLYDSYFTMLFNLQSEKVNKIIICPILKELQKLYEEYGFSLKLLKFLCKEVNITMKQDKNNNKIPVISLAAKNTYLTCGIKLNNKLNKFSFDTSDDYIMYKKLQKISPALLDSDFKGTIPISFDRILTIMTEDELLNHLKWLQHQIEFAIQTIEKYDDSNINRKKKVASIIEEL